MQERSPLDIDRIRLEFPITKKYAYFDNAAVGPLPTRVVETATRVLEEKCEGDLHWESWESTAEETRKSIAILIGASADEIALVHSTSEGVSIVANGLSYEKDSNIVTCDMEFPSNLFPWQALAKRRGMELRVIRSLDGFLRMEDFVQAIDKKTRVVAVSHVQYSNGFRINLEELSKIAHENNAYLSTDAVQAVGEMPVSVSELGVDFLETSGYKWLLSPISTGFLYVRRALLEELCPTIVGYRSDEELMAHRFRELNLAHTARRYEAGQLNFPGFAGMNEAIALLQEIGLDNIWVRIISLVDRLVEGLKRNANVKVRSYLEPEFRSGIVNFACQDPESVVERLQDRGLIISVRGGGLRISPHFYNTEGEVDRLLSGLNAL
jgi:cysteine desulfurase/selenocysteine lyase